MARTVSPDEVRHMAQLSRLVISEQEEKLFARQFGDILGHVEILSGVNTDGVAPLYSPASSEESTREDEARDIRSRSEILANAPETDGECFLVPRIV